MAEEHKTPGTWIREILRPITLLQLVVAFAILAGLYGISLYNYLLFHGIVELACIAVAFSIFIIIWNIRRTIPDAFFLIVGISFLFIGGIDMVHALAYKGMGVFPGNDADLPTQLWIAARYFQSITFLIAAIFIGRSITKDRKYDAGIVLASCTAACALLFMSIFVWQNFPHCFIEGTGLTPFKIASEYIISLILIVTIAILILKREHFTPAVWKFLVAAQVFLILGELAFTTYVSVYGFMNMLGHLFRLISVYLIYRAFMIVTLRQPYDNLQDAYLKITASEEEIRANYEELADVQQALKESERKYRNLYHYAQVGLFETSLKDASVVACNQRYCDLFGFPSVEEALGKDVLGLYESPDARAEVSRILRDQGYIENHVVRFKNRSTGNLFCAVFSARYNHERDVAEGSITDITAQKVAEEMLRENATRLSLALGVGNAGVWEWNTETRQVSFDNPFHALLGYTPGELPGTLEEWLSYHNQEDVAVWMPKAEAYLRGESPIYESEHRIRTKAGEWAWIFTRGQYVTSPATAPRTRFVGIAMNVTEHKRAEAAILASERKFRETVRLLDEGYYSCTLEGVVIEHNVAFNHILGIDPEQDMKGTILPDFWQNPHDRESYVKELLAKGFIRNYTVNAKTVTGKPVIILASAHLVKNEPKQIQWIEGTFLDITDLRLAEKALRDEQEFSRLLLDASPAFYTAIGADGRILMMNRAMLNALEYTSEEIVGTDYMTTVVPAEDREDLIRVFQENIDGRPTVSVNRNISKSGKVYVVEWHGNPVKQESGKPAFFIGVGIDITGRRKAEDEVARMNETLTRQARKLSILNKIITTANRAENRQALLYEILDDTLDLMDYDAGGIYIIDPETGMATIACSRNLLPEFLEQVRTVPVHQPPYDALFLRGQPIITDHYEQISPENAQKTGFCSVVSVPLDTPGGISGCLNVISKKRHVVTEDEKVTLISIARELGNTLRKMTAEEELRESGKRLQEAQEMAHLGFWTWDLKTGHVEWSDEVFRIFGLDPNEFTPRIDSILELSPWPEEQKRDQELIQRATDSHEPGSYEQRFLRPDKSTGYYHSTFQGRYDDRRNIVTIVGTVLDITERRRAEDALRKSEENILLLLNSTAEAIYGLDIHGNCTFCNNACLRLLGYDHQEDLLGKNMHWLIHAKHADGSLYPVHECRIYQAFRKGEGTHVDDEVLWRADGTSFPAEYWSYPQRFKGEVVGAVVTFLDITDRKRADSALRESEEKFRIVAESAPEAIIIQIKGLFTYVNPEACRLFGVTNPADILGKPVIDRFHPDFQEIVRNRISRINDTREPVGRVEEVILRIDGTPVPVEVSAVPVVYTGSCGALVFLTNITERKQAENALIESRAKLAAALASMTDAVFISDTKGLVIDFNDAFVTYHRFTTREECARTFAEYPDIIDVFMANGEPTPLDMWAVPRALRGETVTNAEYSLRRRDTGETWMGSYSFGPIRDKDGMIIGSVVSVRDITEHKQAEQQRESLIRELERKNAELERFTYTVSHDLKSPLITIKGFAGLLESDARSGDQDQLRKDIDRINVAADTMQALLNDVLELSRVGRIINPPKKVEFGMIAREAVDLLAGPLAERGAVVEIEPGLPEVFVDHARIREVLVNLIENAIKFSGDKTKPRIHIGVETGGEMPAFFVRDNGIGIDPRYLARIFNLFEKLNASVPGTGIGLPIVKRIIEGHGGRIWAESEGDGKGTTIRFTLTSAGTDPTDNNNNRQIKEKNK
ncbi:PAS domain S-box protein [uncultured Methanoregula sp.]|uniref:PAS domain S-box protein n=1 Tax=uncultured Methanoregula sp. TaxID=1005933 RepID=UPI002AAA68CA|nr:PAS domain S-box protein [uncultured Methanoregula sp.]